MKKILILFIASIFAACSGDDEPITPEISNEVKVIWQSLNGTYIGSKPDLGTLVYYEEITFRPYSEPIFEEWDNGYKTEEIPMFGECSVLQYYNDHITEVTKEWKYNIDIAYKNAQPTLNYYPSVYGRTETHSITIKDTNTFELDGIIYVKK